MARPSRKTVDWFKHQIKSGDTLMVMEQDYGIAGYAFWFKLLEKLGASDGHYLDLQNETTWKVLVARSKIDEQICRRMLDTLASLKAIDPELYKKDIVWSQNFVDGLRGLYANRSTKTPSPPRFLNENLRKLTQDYETNQKTGTYRVEGVEGVEKSECKNVESSRFFPIVKKLHEATKRKYITPRKSSGLSGYQLRCRFEKWIEECEQVLKWLLKRADLTEEEGVARIIELLEFVISDYRPDERTGKSGWFGWAEHCTHPKYLMAKFDKIDSALEKSKNMQSQEVSREFTE